MFDVNADARANRLYITLDGTMGVDETSDARDASLDGADRLRDGFDVVTDISGFTPPTPEAAEPIKEAQAGLRDRGVDRVVRVTGEDSNAVVTNAFQRRSRDVGYTGETAASRDEADRILDA